MGDNIFIKDNITAWQKRFIFKWFLLFFLPLVLPCVDSFLHPRMIGLQLMSKKKHKRLVQQKLQ